MTSSTYWILRRYDPENPHHVKNESGAEPRLSSGALRFSESQGHQGKHELSVYNSDLLSAFGFEASSILIGQRPGLATAQCRSDDAIGVKVQEQTEILTITADPYPDGPAVEVTVDVAHELVLISADLSKSFRAQTITALALKFRFMNI